MVGLTVGYIAAKPRGGGRNPRGNLRTECRNCKEGLRNVPSPMSSRIELFKQIRRATIDDQRAVLGWLQRKF
jgi:hypothetical protein